MKLSKKTYREINIEIPVEPSKVENSLCKTIMVQMPIKMAIGYLLSLTKEKHEKE